MCEHTSAHCPEGIDPTRDCLTKGLTIWVATR